MHADLVVYANGSRAATFHTIRQMAGAGRVRFLWFLVRRIRCGSECLPYPSRFPPNRSSNAPSRSIGSGNTIVEFLSAAIVVSVCR